MQATPLTLERVVELIEDATQTPRDRLTGDTVLEDFYGWDSMGMVTFISLVESGYAVTLQTQDLLRCPTPSALLKLIEQRKT